MRLIDADAFRIIVADAQTQCGKQMVDIDTTLGIVKEVLDEQPTVDAVKVVHGRWVVEHEESVRCSECCFNRASIKIPMDYCPNCDAKMDGEREDE